MLLQSNLKLGYLLCLSRYKESLANTEVDKWNFFFFSTAQILFQTFKGDVCDVCDVMQGMYVCQHFY